MVRFSLLLLIFLLLGEVFLPLSPAYGANIQPSLSAGLSFFQQNTGGLISQTGYFLLFQVEEREKWIRPTYGGQIEFSTNGNTLIDGQMLGGVEVVANSAAYVKPFIGANALFGWATLTTSGSTFVGLIYGFMLSTGVEIRFSAKDRTSAIRIGSEWRFTAGTVGGGVSGSDLSTLQLSIGLTF